MLKERLLTLASALKSPQEFKAPPSAEVIEVSVPVSTAAVIYEKVRATIDYQEEHLLRRNAILRFIKRNLGSEMPLEKLASQLLRELVWAKYLPNRAVPVSFVHQLIPIFAKYEPILRAAENLKHGREAAFDWILDVLSVELEYSIIPHQGDETLVNVMYSELKTRAAWDQKISPSPEDRDLMLFTAIHKTLLKSNVATLRYRVLMLYYPDWVGASNPARISEIAENLPATMHTIDHMIEHPLTEKLSILVRRKAGVFRVLYDLAESHQDDIEALLDDPEALDRAIAKALTKRTAAFRTRLRRTVLRAVGFLFITKMLLAIILEVPYDFLIAHESSFYPLLVNILFHPTFLALIALTASIPEKKNLPDYQEAIRALLVGVDDHLLNFRVKGESWGTLAKLFSAVYGALFVLVYGAIGYSLTSLGFNWLSITLFLFFISLVTFFGIRIRQSTKDVVLSDARSGMIGSFFDIVMLPVVRAGRWLSHNVSKINVFIYFFDFIIEAPFKVAIRIIESWFAFVREKKEEIS